jgi:monovalent cation/hydrogen antiporter
VIVVRFAWHMPFNAVVRWRHRRVGFHPPRPMLRPTPYRDLIVLTAFSVVLGTLAIHGLTLKPLLRALDLHDDDPVGRELRAARERALCAGLASFARDRSPVAELVRQEFTARLAYEGPNAEAGDATRSAHSEIYRGALQAARQAVLAMRANDEIGDDAFHQMEEELDWLEMAGGGKGELG